MKIFVTSKPNLRIIIHRISQSSSTVASPRIIFLSLSTNRLEKYLSVLSLCPLRSLCLHDMISLSLTHLHNGILVNGVSSIYYSAISFEWDPRESVEVAFHTS